MSLVALCGALIGMLTSLGQGYLPFQLSPLANSAGSWSAAAFGLALLERVPLRGALLGGIALVTMLAGYSIATQLRGFAVGSSLLVFWGAASITIGPALGAGATWVRGTNSVRLTAGTALIVGILVGEAVYGLTVIADTTPTLYWVGQLAVGIGVAVASRPWRRSGRVVALGLALTAAVATAFYVTYSGNLIGLLRASAASSPLV